MKVLLLYCFGKDNIVDVGILVIYVYDWNKSYLWVFFPYLKLFKQTSIDTSFVFPLNFSCVMFELWIILLGKLRLSSASEQILKFKRGKQMDLTIFLSSFVNLSKFFFCFQEDILYLVKYMGV